MLIRWTVLAVIALSLAVIASPARAHEQAIGLTEVSILVPDGSEDCRATACRVEVAHRLSIHDAESTLMSLLGARADLVGDRAAQEKFEAYVADRFGMVASEGDQPITLTLLGGEVERGYYWIYQEGELPAGVTELGISQAVLMDAIPRQTNRVNIRYGEEIETLIFAQSSRLQPYRLD